MDVAVQPEPPNHTMNEHFDTAEASTVVHVWPCIIQTYTNMALIL